MRILFLTHPYPNYVPDLLLHGLRKLMGAEVVDYPRKDCLYRGVIGLGVCPDDQLCKGWFPEDGLTIDRQDIEAKLKSGHFDLVVADQRLAPWKNRLLTGCGVPLVIIDGEDRPASIPAGRWLICRRETDGSDFSLPLPMALPEEVFNLITSYDSEPKKYSLGFLGSCSDGSRQSLLEKLARWFPDSLFTATPVPGRDLPLPQGRLGRRQYYKKLQSCRMVLSLAGAGWDTFRFWENAACNSLHLARQLPIFLPRDFVSGRHLLRFSSSQDLRRQIEPLLEDEGRCREIIAAGRRHLYQYHLTTARAAYFLDRVIRVLGKAGRFAVTVRQWAGDGVKQQPVPDTVSQKHDLLYLGLVRGENYGWGVCSHKLIDELARLRKVHVLNERDGSAVDAHLEGDLFQAFTSGELFPMFPGARGRRNFGYTFFENELTANSLKNASLYDLVLAGSTWCRQRLEEKGIRNCAVLLQGIDPEVFYPGQADSAQDDRFVIFSGGKFELRKGQDLVMRAVKILMDKYPDIFLVACWYNLWPKSVRMMEYSSHISFKYRPGLSWKELIASTCAANGLDPGRVTVFDLVPHKQQRELYLKTSLGLFPNRCEGGTNLVLMEYMACGRPVIASYTSGHKDVVNSQNAILLNDLQDYILRDAGGGLIARWQEAGIDEIVARLEYAYHNRSRLNAIGSQAAADMSKMTWKASARRLLQLIDGDAA